MTQPIDFEHLARYTGGDAELEAEVFSLFREQTEMWLRLLSLDADTEDWKSAAHSLKGSARGIGAFTLASHCEDAERAAEGSQTARSVAAQAIRDETRRVLDAAAAHTHKRDIKGLSGAA